MNWMWGFIMGFNRTRGILSLVTVSLGLVVACDYSLDNYNPSSSSTVYNLTIADLINDTPADAEKTDTTFRLKSTGTAKYGCHFDPSSPSSSTSGYATLSGVDVLDSGLDRTAVFLTTPSAMKISAVNLVLAQATGTAQTGTLAVELRSANNEVPASSYLRQSITVQMNTFTSSPSEILFNLPSTYHASASAPLAVIVIPSFTSTPNSENYISLVKTDKDPEDLTTACSGFPAYKISENAGAQWSPPSTGNALRRGYFNLVAATHTPSGSGHWVVDASTRSEWFMSTFTITEAPEALGGSVTYDVGSSDSVSPYYNHTGLTKAQLQSLANLEGRYFFLKVNLSSSSSPHFERPEITQAGIEAKPIQ